MYMKDMILYNFFEKPIKGKVLKDFKNTIRCRQLSVNEKEIFLHCRGGDRNSDRFFLFNFYFKPQYNRIKNYFLQTKKYSYYRNFELSYFSGKIKWYDIAFKTNDCYISILKDIENFAKRSLFLLEEPFYNFYFKRMTGKPYKQYIQHINEKKIYKNIYEFLTILFPAIFKYYNVYNISPLLYNRKLNLHNFFIINNFVERGLVPKSYIEKILQIILLSEEYVILGKNIKIKDFLKLINISINTGNSILYTFSDFLLSRLEPMLIYVYGNVNVTSECFRILDLNRNYILSEIKSEPYLITFTRFNNQIRKVERKSVLFDWLERKFDGDSVRETLNEILQKKGNIIYNITLIRQLSKCKNLKEVETVLNLHQLESIL